MRESTLIPGTVVAISGLRRVATIVEGPNGRNQYKVAIGGGTTWLDTSKLRAVPARRSARNAPPDRRTRSHRTRRRSIDLHGLSVERGVAALKTAIDRALLDGCDELEVIHGIGTGKVMSGVHRFLRSVKHVRDFHVDFANLGVTKVYF